MRIVVLLASVLFLLSGAGAELPTPRPDTAVQKSVVWFALDSRAMGSGMMPKQAVVSQMVGGLVCEVTGKSTPEAA